MSVIFGSLSEECRSSILDLADDQKETAVLPITHCKMLGCEAIFYSYKLDDHDMLFFSCKDKKLLSSWKLVKQEYNNLCKSIFQDKGMQFSAIMYQPDEIRYLHMAVFKDHVMFIYYNAKLRKRSPDLLIIINKYRRSGSGLSKFMEDVGYKAFDGFYTPNIRDPIKKVDFMLGESKNIDLEWKIDSTEAAAVVRRGDNAFAFASGGHKRLGRYSALFHLPEHMLEKIYLKSEERISTFALFTILKDWLIPPASSSSMAEFCCALCNKMIHASTQEWIQDLCTNKVQCTS